jgi:hypothetical protein
MEEEKSQERRRRRLITERKRALRRNVRLKLKQGYFENLPEAVDINRRVWYDDGR